MRTKRNIIVLSSIVAILTFFVLYNKYEREASTEFYVLKIKCSSRKLPSGHQCPDPFCTCEEIVYSLENEKRYVPFEITEQKLVFGPPGSELFCTDFDYYAVFHEDTARAVLGVSSCENDRDIVTVRGFYLNNEEIIFEGNCYSIKNKFLADYLRGQTDQR